MKRVPNKYRRTLEDERPDDFIDVYRCRDCRAIFDEFSITDDGQCPACGSKRARSI